VKTTDMLLLGGAAWVLWKKHTTGRWPWQPADDAAGSGGSPQKARPGRTGRRRGDRTSLVPQMSRTRLAFGPSVDLGAGSADFDRTSIF
jgi:hypothetical protein